MNLEQFRLNPESLIPCRRAAWDGAAFRKLKLNSGRFWDLYCLFNGQWHYIATRIKHD